MAFPGSGGSITVDEVRIFNGSAQRYNWNIVGKKELYIPYNTARLHANDLKYASMLTPGHINPDNMRYELHRVWVLEGVLKPGNRHLYGCAYPTLTPRPFSVRMRSATWLVSSTPAWPLRHQSPSRNQKKTTTTTATTKRPKTTSRALKCAT